MRKRHNALQWYLKFNKRLLKRVSFIIVLLMIPVTMFAFSMAASGDSGVVTVVLSCEDADDLLYREISGNMLSDGGILLFKSAESAKEARELVKSGKADMACIFASDLEEKVEKYSASERRKKSFITVIEREDNIPLQLARNFIFCKVYPYISYNIYNNYVRNGITGDEVSESVRRSYYEEYNDLSDIIDIKVLNENYANPNENINYLNAPFRGMLSLLVMICGLAAVMYFLQDSKEGRYDWLSYKKRILPAFGLCLAAVSLSSLAILSAIYLSGINTYFYIEIMAIILFILAATGFCMLMCVLFKSAVGVGASMPFFIISMFTLSPIFFNLKAVPYLRCLIPTNYYLRIINQPEYIGYSLIYIVAVYAIAIVVNRLKYSE